MNESMTVSNMPHAGEQVRLRDIERDLVVSAKDGSAVAFDQLVARYRSRLFRVAYNITRHYHDAEDVIQTAFLKAFNKLPLFRGDSSFYTWLVSITVNEALMRIRRRPIGVLIDDSRELDDTLVADDFLHAPQPNPEQWCSRGELRSILTVAINKLRPEYRVVFQLRHIDDLSLHEIAEALNLTLPAVKTRLHRARVTLRHSLHKLFRPPNRAMKQTGERPGLFAERCSAPWIN